MYRSGVGAFGGSRQVGSRLPWRLRHVPALGDS